MIRSINPDFRDDVPQVRCPLVYAHDDRRQRILNKVVGAVSQGEIEFPSVDGDPLFDAILESFELPSDPFKYQALRAAAEVRHVAETILYQPDKHGEQSDYLRAIGFRLTWDVATGKLIRARPGLVRWQGRGNTLRLACPIWCENVEGEDFLHCGYSLAAAVHPGHVRQALGRVTPEIVELCLNAGVRDTILGCRRRDGYAAELEELTNAIESVAQSEADDSEPPF